VSVREHKNAVVAVIVGAVAVTVHLGLGAVIVRAAARWMNWLAIAAAVAVVLLLHVAGFRRLASRRNRTSQPTSDGDRHDRLDLGAADQHPGAERSRT
jgi:membrane protein implicated in regulation of membrane protease activity